MSWIGSPQAAWTKTAALEPAQKKMNEIVKCQNDVFHHLIGIWIWAVDLNPLCYIPLVSWVSKMELSIFQFSVSDISTRGSNWKFTDRITNSADHGETAWMWSLITDALVVKTSTTSTSRLKTSSVYEN